MGSVPTYRQRTLGTGASSPRLATCLSWCANDVPRASRPRTRWHGACSSPRAVAQALSTPLRSREHCRTLGTIEGARLATAYGGEAKQKGPIRPALVPHRHHQASGEHRDRVLPDIGDVQDKAMALAIAFDALASSERSWGCDVLRRLRHHICTTRAVQSVQWVLPQVETAMRACAGDSSPLRGVKSPSTPQSPSVSRARPASRKGSDLVICSP